MEVARVSEEKQKVLSPESVWREYTAAVGFKGGMGLFDTVRRNETFYIGEQWEGVNAPDLDKPVFNLLRRVVSYFISSIVSDDIAVGVSGFGAAARQGPMLEMLGGQFSEVMEQCGAKHKFRDMIRNAAVDGDGCIHYYFEPGEEAGDFEDYIERGTSGYIEAEVLDNTAVCFGNPQLCEVQRQPYIIVAFRRRVGNVRAAARANARLGKTPQGVFGPQRQQGNNQQEDDLLGCEADSIVPDEDIGGVRDANNAENEKVTVLRRYWKQGGQVWFAECTAGANVKAPTATGYTRYPLVWMPWEKVKNRYHGQAAITGMIPNQIFVNKLFAMAMQHVKMLAFPKVVYDRTKLPGGWSNQVGGAVGVAGSPLDAVMSGVQAPEMSSQVLAMIEKVIAYTRDTMGATDAALGNIKPENTSAIIAVQKASSMPLELQKMEFYRVVEDSVRVWLDMMGANYGVRTVLMAASDEEGAGGEDALQRFDFSTLRGMNLRLNVDIGAATYWSELVQVQTLDNLFERGIIPDAETYLEMVPAAYIRDKALLLEAIRRKRAEMAEGGEALEEAGLEEQLAADPPPETPLLDLLGNGG